MRERGIGDNGGPPLDPDESWRHWNWKRARKRAWKTPPREVALRRLANAEALGLTYKEYALELMERGVYANAEQAQAIIARRPAAPAAGEPERLYLPRWRGMRRRGHR
jgi:hypothetical protein